MVLFIILYKEVLTVVVADEILLAIKCLVLTVVFHFDFVY